MTFELKGWDIDKLEAGLRKHATPNPATGEPYGMVMASVADWERMIAALRHLARIRAVVDAQAEDAGLWFVAKYATEARLQQELRRLHALIEEECAALKTGAGP